MNRGPKIAIAAPVREEAAYLIEWIAHHRALGVEEIILGDNGGDDGTSDLLRNLDRAGLIRRLDFVGKRFFQDEFNAAALEVARKVCDAVLYIDADEFVRIADPIQNGLDAIYYLEANPDVSAHHVDPLEHFRIYGWRERRNPNAWFDTRFYLEKNPDVARLEIDPLRHFEEIGWSEGRDPSARFSVRDYLGKHSQLCNGRLCPLDHFLENEAYDDGSRRKKSLVDLAESWLSDASFGGVAINWAIYGSNGLRTWDKGLVTERFTNRARRDFSANAHVKSLVRAASCRRMLNPHAAEFVPRLLQRVRGPFKYLTTTGSPVCWQPVAQMFAGPQLVAGFATTISWQTARIDHFCLKSVEEFENKRKRGAPNSAVSEAARFADDYFDSLDHNDVYDPTPRGRLEETRREIELVKSRLNELEHAGA